MKKQINMTFFSLLIIICFGFTPGTNNSEWQLYKEIDGIKIYNKTINCDYTDESVKKEMVFIKLVNTTSAKVSLEWDMELWYNNVCRTCNLSSNDYHYSVTLSANETKEGSCRSEKELKIFSKFIVEKELNGLTKFNFANIKIKKI